MTLTPCDTKVLYDTEFEATIAAAHHRTAMVPYQCGKHYHLTHADPNKRIGHGRVGRYARCPHCKQIYDRKGSNQQTNHLNKKCLEKPGQ